MYSTICKTKENTDRQIVEFIYRRVFWLIKSWWDHYLTPKQRYEVINAIKLKHRT